MPILAHAVKQLHALLASSLRCSKLLLLDHLTTDTYGPRSPAGHKMWEQDSITTLALDRTTTFVILRPLHSVTSRIISSRSPSLFPPRVHTFRTLFQQARPIITSSKAGTIADRRIKRIKIRKATYSEQRKTTTHFGMINQVPGPSRRSHTKSRRGCQTCKRRHIRCDESTPQW